MKYPNPFNRTMKIAALILIGFFVLTATASAGVLGDAKDWFMSNAIEAAVGALFLIISGFFGGSTIGKILLRSKLPITELVILIKVIHDTSLPSSPGGTKRTETEKDEIIEQAQDLIKSVVKVFGNPK